MAADYKPNPFDTRSPGVAEGEWLKEEHGFSSLPTFRYVAPDTMKGYVLHHRWQFGYPTAHGIVIVSEPPVRLPAYRLSTYRLRGKVQDEAAREASVGDMVNIIAVQVRTGDLVIFEQRAVAGNGGQNDRIIPIHDILVGGTTYARDIIAQL